MTYFLYGLFFLSCLVLVATVLLQPGKTDAGALFTSNISSSAFAPRGTATVLSKVTIVAATCFMLSALLLAMPALNGNVSVLSSNPADAPANADANSNSSANTSDANANTSDANANANANTAANVNPDNTNGALIQTPATDEAANKAANAQKPSVTMTNSTGNSATFKINRNKPGANK